MSIRDLLSRATLNQKWRLKIPIGGLLCGGFLLAALIGMLASAHASEAVVTRVSAIIKKHLSSERDLAALSCRGEMICSIRMLPQAYRKRNYLPLWIDASLSLQMAETLAGYIQRAGEDGLTPRDYHLQAIYDLLADVSNHASEAGVIVIRPELWADLDLILTDAFLLYGSHLSAGRVNPETLHTDWKINPEAVNLLAALESVGATGDIAAALDGLRPSHNDYKNLRETLATLRDVAAGGGWPLLPNKKTLRPGDRTPDVKILRHRLIHSGDWTTSPPTIRSPIFDEVLVAAVKQFQKRHGLKTDGIVGRNTYAMLNQTVEQRIRQVILNLERLRWLPHDLGSRHILVNTAGFHLKMVNADQPVRQMRVVVGRPARRSPVFSARMTYLVANPYWNIPTTIAVEDILPELQKDSAYLAHRGIRVFQSWDADAPELDPAGIDWQAYHADRFPFRFRQDPGPSNPLGRFKFMFPNQFAVYLHDTPDRALFTHVQRDYSSGCIRVESPADLAEFVLSGDKRWTMERLNQIIANGQPRIIRLKHPIPVHLLYMTAWVDEMDGIHFRDDIYEQDHALARALIQRKPTIPIDFSQSP